MKALRIRGMEVEPPWKNGSLIFARFGADVMENVANWTKNLCLEVSQSNMPIYEDNVNCLSAKQLEKDLSAWSRDWQRFASPGVFQTPGKTP